MEQTTFDKLQDEELFLNAKIIRLRDFMETDKFRELEPVDQNLLDCQLYFMREYSRTLGQRIRRELERG